jgi:hypothetical protein
MILDEGRRDTMTDYLILIYGDERRWDALSADERGAVDDAHRRFRETAGDRILAAGELEDSTLAVTLRTAGDGFDVTDGPFAEAKEVVGGFYLVRTHDREEAVALAGLLEEARQGHGGIQVHPLVDHG